jgi:group II intron reverse transcriptase/maturase
MVESKSKVKSFVISEKVVWEAWKQVQANQGAAGVDEESVRAFEANLEGNLYKIWNRMSSGTYMPPSVKAVQIPKKDGRGVRTLGVPTVADRVAQTVVKLYLEPEVEPVFHEDSYGYRPGRSALDAVRVCRERCWRRNWVIDLDYAAFFDSIDHELMLKAVAAHTDHRWVMLYVERWLKASLDEGNGILVARDRGTPQGSAISPVLANIYLHYGKRRDKTGMGKGMRTPDTEGVATRSGPESCACIREGAGEALAGVRAGWVIEPRNRIVRGADALVVSGRQHRRRRYRESFADPARSESLCMHGVPMRENREVP